MRVKLHTLRLRYFHNINRILKKNEHSRCERKSQHSVNLYDESNSAFTQYVNFYEFYMDDQPLAGHWFGENLWGIDRRDVAIFDTGMTGSLRMDNKLSVVFRIAEYLKIDFTEKFIETLVNHYGDSDVNLEWYMNYYLDLDNLKHTTIYECYCGCDLCGSYKIQVLKDNLCYYWKIDTLNFVYNKTQYEKEFKRFFKEAFNDELDIVFNELV